MMVYIERQLNADIKSINLKIQLFKLFEMVGHTEMQEPQITNFTGSLILISTIRLLIMLGKAFPNFISCSFLEI